MPQISVYNLIITEIKLTPWGNHGDMKAIEVRLAGRKATFRMMAINEDVIIFDLQEVIGMSLDKGQKYIRKRVVNYHKTLKLLGGN